ncbi:MAG: UDP-N-acetylmuramoylalanyl-D-glutamyl-2, 6-diaminopimelate--D-alanyl-D-alanine ligase [Bdellovibrionales bacterium RIFCSPHIGHO2_01_FULL_40_29]|nr:MAG: UDP-N-acetylmuramoylalanyl-D-glutamyl-2, 6-diaminopimelate--D-alanyl-D-alanine ligase [Bdellovibrionales bacterium RIFCSPHIGHO2_01_FULL_40_29]OFZ34017.1 MAG: UDP-N-acetylmuramoylalanyl-D-glutamyl-2, 6-diaminopimelate--D-alanyl-D-alanine ligase [Bdellovibrionales bacterium RIFCSPHIGHO2_02_FULL_40_15]
MKWKLADVVQWTNGKLLSTFKNEFHEIGTDTRTDLTGKIFIALKGDTFDAHQFLDLAVKQGAAALIVHHLEPKFENLKSKVSIIKVDDTLKALQDFSHQYRKTLKAKIIGITGSNGKTTTKEFTAQILSSFKKTHYNQGSFNNHWGVPLTLLQIDADVEFAVVEMGMNHPGEITKLVQIADPDIVVCTMVGSAHMGPMGGLANIAKAKSEIYMDSREDTIRIFNQDQDWTFDMMYPVAKKYPASRMLSFSANNDKADVYFKIEELSMATMKITGTIADRKGSAEVPVFGKQNLGNLMAAATIAYVCNMPVEKIWKALEKCHTAWGRNQFIKTNLGADVLFDGYNANPDSMDALLENIPLLKNTGKKIGAFGQMKELGEESPEAHIKLGMKMAQAGFSELYFIGEDYKFVAEGIARAKFSGVTVLNSDFTLEMGAKLAQSISPGDIVVVKGSRGAATERFIECLDPIDWKKK